jgi:hypothetical protein
MSGRTAAEANHKLIPAISARTRSVIETSFDLAAGSSEPEGEVMPRHSFHAAGLS